METVELRLQLSVNSKKGNIETQKIQKFRPEKGEKNNTMQKNNKDKNTSRNMYKVWNFITYPTRSRELDEEIRAAKRINWSNRDMKKNTKSSISEIYWVFKKKTFNLQLTEMKLIRASFWFNSHVTNSPSHIGMGWITSVSSKFRFSWGKKKKNPFFRVSNALGGYPLTASHYLLLLWTFGFLNV